MVSKDNKSYLPALDGLRGMFALAVALSHFLGSSSGWKSYFFQNSYLAVDLFFMLSGMVLSVAYYRSFVTNKMSDLRFFLIRLSRLYPLHLISMLITGMAYTIYWNMHDGFQLKPLPFENVTSNTILHLLLINNVGLSQDWSWNEPSWSVSVELWIGCLILPFLFKLSGRALITISFMLYSTLFLSVDSLRHSHENIFQIFNIGLIRGVAGFSLGVALYHLINIIKVNDLLIEMMQKNRRIIGFIELLSLVIILGVMFVNYDVANALEILVLISTAIVVVSTSVFRSPLSIFLALPKLPFSFIGKISFSLYLLHTSIIWIVAKILDVPSSNIAIVIYLAILLPVSYLSYRLVELNLYHWLKTRVNKYFN